MPQPRYRSKAQAKLFVRVPSGRTVVHYRRRLPGKAVCGVCGALLSGVPRARPAAMRKLPKSKKKPNRPYGGNLCPKCSRRMIIERVRESEA
ncbi:MAG: 50S ribosomal protein L34e [Candidatus Hydrothermarchaeota archaeon]|nr:MAG: 50S ribosomal protein L34e [Candidatus Hydrothermarchaeota archaeon]